MTLHSQRLPLLHTFLLVPDPVDTFLSTHQNLFLEVQWSSFLLELFVFTSRFLRCQVGWCDNCYEIYWWKRWFKKNDKLNNQYIYRVYSYIILSSEFSNTKSSTPELETETKSVLYTENVNSLRDPTFLVSYFLFYFRSSSLELRWWRFDTLTSVQWTEEGRSKYTTHPNLLWYIRF